MVFYPRWKSCNNSTHASHTAFLFPRATLASAINKCAMPFYMWSRMAANGAVCLNVLATGIRSISVSRWSKAGVLDRIFAELQQAHILRLRIEAVSLDSTDIKVHPDGGGELKKMANNRLESAEADRPPHCIRLSRMRERLWRFVDRQAIIMMHPLCGC